ncbi:hypothetical protein JXA12_04365 [Candidatus Woesearchaeota archaeon]|nr:hypothetical protein [Candidatus Woesearchaeota archaeon]
MKLKDAVDLYKAEPGAFSNAYEWYRKSANARGYVALASTEVPAYKKGREWYVDDDMVSKAINGHRERMALEEKYADDLKKGVVYGNDGDMIRFKGGRYSIRGGFRYEVFDYKSHAVSGVWKCNKCNQPAKLEHNKEECHLCSDWNGCGRDCTLSKVFCELCGAKIDL